MRSSMMSIFQSAFALKYPFLWIDIHQCPRQLKNVHNAPQDGGRRPQTGRPGGLKLFLKKAFFKNVMPAR